MDSDDSAGADTDTSVGRKRPHVTPPLASSSGSDTETGLTVSARAVKTRKEGHAKRTQGSGLVRARAELRNMEEEAREKAFEDALDWRAFHESGGSAPVEIESLADEGPAHINPADQSAEELRAAAGQSVADIIEVAQKSGNLKGTFMKRLKDSAVLLQNIVEALVGRTAADEARHLQAENVRLRRETESLRSELKAYRREFSGMRAELAATKAGPSEAFGSDWMEEFRASIVASVGAILDARFAGIEDRLLPAAPIRPPLAADRRAVAVAPSPAPVPSTVRPAPAAAVATGSSAVQRSKPKKKSESHSAQRRAPAPAPALVSLPPPAPVAGSSRAEEAPEETWATVVRKGKGKGKKSSPPAAANSKAAPSKAAPVQRASAPAKIKVASPPRTAAVIITLQQEAAAKGITYAQVLEKAQQSVDLVQIGVTGGLSVRRAVTGARLLELPSSVPSEVADRLAEKLRQVLDGLATVARPVRMADLRVYGLDDSVTREKVAAAVARAGNCSFESVKVSEIFIGKGGMGSAIAKCPVTAAKVVADAGKVLVGWSAAKVQVLEQRPLRCFRCMGIGHTVPVCPSKVERGRLCYRCGSEGHQSVDCSATAIRCAVCADAGRPSGHRMGGSDCNPPITKGLPAQRIRAAPRIGSRQAGEESQMSS